MIATFTATEVVQILTALGILLPILGGFFVAIIMAIKRVEGKVNGTATETQKELKALRAEVTELKADRAEKKEEAALLAQTAASHSAATPIPVVVANTQANPVPVLPPPP